MASLKLGVKEKKPEVTNDRGQSYDESLDEAKRQLYREFVDGMRENSANVEISEESLAESAKKYKSLKMKKIAILVCICLAVLSLVVFGVYNTFFRHEYTPQEIAAYANYYNGRTNFPTYGVQGFLDKNIKELMSEQLTIDRTVSEFEITNPTITKMVLKDHTLTNVYFYVDITTNNGTNRVKCMLPVGYVDGEYRPAGTVIFTSNESTVGNVERTPNSWLTFEGLTKASDEETALCKAFVDNFFKILYTGGDVTPYYQGNTLDPYLMRNGEETEEISRKMTYEAMTEFVYYTDINKQGYNAFAKITLHLPGGIVYKSSKYLYIEKTGSSWMIKGII